MDNTKIRLIFCDVDGTLLPSGHNAVSNDTFHALNSANSSNIMVCIASGRSYPELKALFSPLVDRLTFICNDGALVVKNNDVIFSSPLSKSQVACMSKTYKQDYSAIVLYTKDNIYYLSDTENLASYKKITTQDILNVPDDIFKVAFLKLSERAKIKIDNLGIKSGVLNKVYEDQLWTEYVTFSTNKGLAAKQLQHIYRISQSETAAFGDNVNDIEMLRQAVLTYAPKTAKPEITRMCKFTTNNVNNEILNIINSI